MAGQTKLSIDGDRFLIGGEPTHKGTRCEGLLMNSRMVQGTFDDLNPETRPMWDGPDGAWDAQANTDRFVAAMPSWREHGLIGFTVNMQGGSPQGYSREQPWINPGYHPDGTPREDYLGRLGAILDRADELGMVPIVGLFYFGQDQHVEGEAAVCNAVDAMVDWILGRRETNVMIEIANEADLGKDGKSPYENEILRMNRGDELIRRVQERSGGRIPVSTSSYGGSIPTPNVIEAGDFVLLHGNGVQDPNRISKMVRIVKEMDVYRGQPIVFNEDDHFDFDKPTNNMLAAIDAGAGWGFFDYRMKNESHKHGYQSVPTDWTISSERKRGFFGLLKSLTGGS